MKLNFVALMAAGTMMAALPLAAQDDPPGRVARIDRMQGDVSLLLPGSDGWTDAPPNYPLFSGARIYSGDSSQVEIQSGGAEVRGWGDTDITLTNLTDGYEQLALATGSIRVSIFSMNQGDTVEVDTPNGAVIMQQPGSYRVDAYPSENASDLAVANGLAVVAAPGGLNQEVGPGQAVQLFGANPTDMESTGYPPPDGLDNWSAGLDYAYRNSMSARYVSPYMVGYGDLDANGTWGQGGEYGPVWYPNVDQDWRPYSAGHWDYVAPWGYTWMDDESWGYAPFHYGRWVDLRGRWGWVPGPRDVRPIYSPALVAFVGGAQISIGGGGVAAWFPLGVGEPYVPWYRCSPSYARDVNESNVNVTYIHDRTIVNNFNIFVANTRSVTNVTNITVNNVVYANRTQVVAVPAGDMSSGHSVARAQIRLTPDVQRQLASAPVHAAPSAPPPARPLLVAKTMVRVPVAPPTVLTPRGAARATPAANPAAHAPAPLPRPQPASFLAKPQPGVVAGRPPTQRPAQAAQPGRPGAGSNPTMPQSQVRPATPGAVMRPEVPARTEPAPAPMRPAPPVQPAPPERTAPPERPAPPVITNRPVPPPELHAPAPPPAMRPAPPPAPETRPVPPPAMRPAPPPARTEPAPKPEYRPAPPPVQRAPAPPPAMRPAPPPPPARAEPAPRPENRPAVQPANKPPANQPPPKKKPEEKPQ